MLDRRGSGRCHLHVLHRGTVIFVAPLDLLHSQVCKNTQEDHLDGAGDDDDDVDDNPINLVMSAATFTRFQSFVRRLDAKVKEVKKDRANNNKLTSGPSQEAAADEDVESGGRPTTNDHPSSADGDDGDWLAEFFKDDAAFKAVQDGTTVYVFVSGGVAGLRNVLHTVADGANRDGLYFPWPTRSVLPVRIRTASAASEWIQTSVVDGSLNTVLFNAWNALYPLAVERGEAKSGLNYPEDFRYVDFFNWAARFAGGKFLIAIYAGEELVRFYRLRLVDDTPSFVAPADGGRETSVPIAKSGAEHLGDEHVGFAFSILVDPRADVGDPGNQTAAPASSPGEKSMPSSRKRKSTDDGSDDDNDSSNTKAFEREMAQKPKPGQRRPTKKPATQVQKRRRKSNVSGK